MLDEIDGRILLALSRDARASLKDVADRAGLSSPSAAERMRRLLERGVIRAYTVDLNAQALGYALEALVRVRPLPGKVHIVEKLLREIPEVCECDKVTGEDCFVVRLFARSMGQLDEIIDRIAGSAETNTSIVKSQPILRRPPPLTPPDDRRPRARRSGVARK